MQQVVNVGSGVVEAAVTLTASEDGGEVIRMPAPSDNAMGLTGVCGAQSYRSGVTVTLQVYYLFTVLYSIFTHLTYIYKHIQQYIHIYSKYKSKKNSSNFQVNAL